MSSFNTTDRHPVPDEGFTQASIVIPVVRSSDAALATVTHALVPLNDSAPPNLPAAVRVALEIVPVLPWPDASVTCTTPLASLNPYAATSPLGVCAVFDTTTSTVACERFPAASRATAASVWGAFDVVAVFHVTE